MNPIMKKVIFIFSIFLLGLPTYAQSDVKAIEIVEKSIASTGGKDKMTAIKSMSRKMEISMPFGTSESESFYKKGKFYSKSTMQGNVVMEQKYDGSRFAMNGMQGAQTIDDEKAVKRMAQQGKIFPVLDLLDEGLSMKFEGTIKIEGKECNKIVSKDADGNESVMFFDAATNTLSRMMIKSEWQGNATEQTIDLKDYKMVDGLLFAHKMSMNTGQFQMEMKTTEIKLNIDIKDSMFLID